MKILITLFSILVLGACKSQQTTSPKLQQTTAKNISVSTDQNGIVLIKEGYTADIKNKDLSITFNKVIEDSRCPEGLQCIWAGNLSIEISVKAKNIPSKTYMLSTTSSSQKNLEFNGYNISIASLTPYPKFSPNKSEKEITTSVKTLGLKIAPKSSNTSSTSTTR